MHWNKLYSIFNFWGGLDLDLSKIIIITLSTGANLKKIPGEIKHYDWMFTLTRCFLANQIALFQMIFVPLLLTSDEIGSSTKF